MRMRTAYFMVLAALLAASDCFAAKVTNVELTYRNGYTVARIDVEGTIRFTHQTEIAKDGKPFRVIVDVLSATHELGAKSFLSLPKCAVLHIRSSQYSVKPERIVRLVFDMGTESVYQIDSDTKSIKLKFPDKSSKAFMVWSTRNVVSTPAKQKSQKKVLVSASTSVALAVSESARLSSKTATQLNRSIEADRQASIASTETSARPRKEATAQPKNLQLASNSAPDKSEPKKKISRPRITKKTLARASGSKALYPSDQEAAKFEPGKVVENARVSTEKKPSVAKEQVVGSSKPGNEVHAGLPEKSEKGLTKPYSPTVKNYPKISDPRTTMSSVSAGKTVAPKQESKPAITPVPASTSSDVNTEQPVIKKAKNENVDALKKKAAKQTGSLNKAGTAVRSDSSPKQERSVAGKSSTDSAKDSSAPKESVTRPAGSTPKPDAVEKSSKAVKSSPVKLKPKKKKKAVYASTEQVKSSGAAKPVSGKETKAKTEKKIAKKSSRDKVPASSAKSAPGTGKQVVKKKDDNQRATSRFRRSRAQSNKIKGTMVAEFPKRLVIKYRGNSRRDPFETLVNERKTNNSPLERRVPNPEGLKLVGVIEASDGDNRALFEDTDGFGYIMKSGDKVRKGYVLRVESDRVYFQIFEYGWSRTVALNLEEY